MIRKWTSNHPNAVTIRALESQKKIILELLKREKDPEDIKMFEDDLRHIDAQLLDLKKP